MGYQNFFATRLATEIGASDTVITLENVPGETEGKLVLEARNPTQREIITYTGISGNQITGVVRGYGGTTAKPHLKNALVEMNLTAEDLQELYDLFGTGSVQINGAKLLPGSVASDKIAPAAIVPSKLSRSIIIGQTGASATSFTLEEDATILFFYSVRVDWSVSGQGATVRFLVDGSSVDAQGIRGVSNAGGSHIFTHGNYILVNLPAGAHTAQVDNNAGGNTTYSHQRWFGIIVSQ